MRTWLFSTALLLAAATGFVGTAAAQDISGKAKQAEALLAQGKIIEAIAALD